MSKKFYLTTTLPYVNAKPHVGHALEFVRADVLARYKRSEGFDVFLNTGTDEHGQKLFDAAEKMGVPVQKYVDENSLTFRSLLKNLGFSEEHYFSRTTSKGHIKAASSFWKLVADNGYIYKARYQTKYCVGCELEKTDSELVNGHCPDHPNLDIEVLDEENYFFKYSAFEKPLLDLYEKNPEFVVPQSRMNEIKSFVSRGLKDFSISRLSTKMPWGIPVSNDPEHVMYVWFDALVSYISALGWPDDAEKFKTFWAGGNPTQYCGQDNLRQQSATWQAMLLAAGLPNSHQILVNGFVMGEGGVKMSKTLGNVIDPQTLIEQYGTDALRYYLLRHIHPFDGSPMSYESFKQAYDGNLVNGLGNLTSRLLTMSEKYLDKPISVDGITVDEEWRKNMEAYRFDIVCDYIWSEITSIDQAIAINEPFKLIKKDEAKAKGLLTEYLGRLYKIALMLQPLIPATSQKIIGSILANKKPEAQLFPKVM